MILLKTEEQINGIRKSCHLLAQLFDYLEGRIVAGMSTWDIDQLCHDFIIKHGGKPAFLHYEGFPASACVSVNEEVIHGIPKRKRIIHEGDDVSVDLGINLGGYFSDSARTYMIGNVIKAKLYLIELEKRQNKLNAIVGEKKNIEWGSQIRSYVFCPYTLVKDNRTEYEKTDVESVMNGDIDGFLYAYLQMEAKNNV